MSRRQLLQRAGVAGAIGLVPLGIASCGDTGRVHAAYGQLRALTTEQAAALDAITARLIPTDENGPGAREAKVLRYIDRALATAYREQQPAYAAGLAALDRYSRTRFRGRFADLAPDKQDMVLVSVEQGDAPGFEPSSSVFFATVLQHTLEGMFGDPFWGGNANFVGWDLIGFTGIQLTWSAEMQQLDAAEQITPTVFPAHQGMSGLPGYTAKQIEGILDD